MYVFKENEFCEKNISISDPKVTKMNGNTTAQVLPLTLKNANILSLISHFICLHFNNLLTMITLLNESLQMSIFYSLTHNQKFITVLSK